MRLRRSEYARRTAHPAIALILLATFTAHPSSAQIPKTPLFTLARTWAPPNTEPTCARRGPRGEFIPASERYCRWPTPRGTTLGAFVFTLPGSPSTVMWDRWAKDSASAKQIVDSLGASLVKQRFRAFRCRDRIHSATRLDGMLWKRVPIAVYVFIPWPEPDGTMRTMSIIATDSPIGLPAIMTASCTDSTSA